jgi:hypothetical protein
MYPQLLFESLFGFMEILNMAMAPTFLGYVETNAEPLCVEFYSVVQVCILTA